MNQTQTPRSLKSANDAYRIQELERENARLREALERIKRGPDDEDDRGGELMGIARAALEST